MHSLFRLLTASSFILASQFLSAADSVTLSNGNILEGEIVSIDNENTLKFKHPASSELIEIDSKKLQKLLFNVGDKSSTKNANSMLRFVNGDSIMADITAIDDNSISFTSPSTGSHTVARQQVTSIKFGDAITQTLYNFDNTKKPFNHNKGWLYKESKGHPTLKAQNSAQMWQSFDLTKEFILKFNLAWDSDAQPQLVLHLGATGKQILNTNSRYEVLMQSRSIAISQHINGRKFTIGSGRSELLRNNPKRQIQVEIRVSRTERKVVVYINGRKVAQTNQKDKTIPIPPTGKFIGFQNYSSSNPISIKEMNLQTWDGLDTPDKVTSIPASADDVVEIDNGDVFSGKLNSISKDSKGALQCNFSSTLFASGSATYPLKNITSLLLKSKAIEASKMKPSKLRSGGSVKLSEVVLEGGVIKAKHPILGELSFKKSAFTALKIN